MNVNVLVYCAALWQPSRILYAHAHKQQYICALILHQHTLRYTNDFEAALLSGDSQAYSTFLDVPAAIDYMLGTELTKNPDGYRWVCGVRVCVCTSARFAMPVCVVCALLVQYSISFNTCNHMAQTHTMHCICACTHHTTGAASSFQRTLGALL